VSSPTTPIPARSRRSGVLRALTIVAILLILGTAASGALVRPVFGADRGTTIGNRSGGIPASGEGSVGVPGEAGSNTQAVTTASFDGVPAPADAPPASDVAGDEVGLTPSIQYEEALAHAADPNRFVAGDRVRLAYTPRADDGWPVDGQAPTPLPAGSATGRAMAAAPQGSVWVGTPADGSQPAPDPSQPVDQASPVGFRSQAEPAVARPAAEPDASSPAAASGLRRQVFGFLPYWTLGDSSTVLKYDYLSTIAYFSVGSDAKGNLLKRNKDGSLTTGWGGWTSSAMTRVIDSAHAHHTRVVLTISVFAWTSGEATKQGTLLGSPTARLNLARQAAAAVRNRGADGINLDFEPIASGHAADFTAFVRTLRAELRKIRSGYQLTFDTTGFIGNYPIEGATASGGADAIFIMGYDYRGSGASTAGSIDPLNGSGYTLADTIRAYTARVPASRLILGLPYYGRAWSTTSSALRAPNQSGTKYGASTSVIYDTAADLVHVYGRRYDPTEAVAWFAYRRQNCSSTYGCVTSWRQIYFDDAQSLKARYDLVIRSGLRGSGMWALGYDARRPELYGALSLKYLHDTTAPESGITILPSKSVDDGVLVRWKAIDDSKIRNYDVQVSIDGGGWTPWKSATLATSDVYLGATGHGYAFRVRATDAYGNVGSWDVSSRFSSSPALETGGFGRVRVDGLALRVSPDTAALAVATVSTGQILAVTGGPVGADGYTWYEVAGPLAEWNTVAFTRSGVWVAARSATASYVSAAHAPNATLVDAGVDSLTFGDDGSASLGASSTALDARAFSPNGNGSKDRLRLRWTNRVALDSISLRVYRTDGTLVGSRALVDTAIGAQSYDWDGLLTGIGQVGDGRYLVQLVGVGGATTYTAPSARPATTTQVARYAVTIDRSFPVYVASSVSGHSLSPNGDGRFDSVTTALSTTGGTAWTFTASPVSGSSVGAPIRTAIGSGTSARVTWTGTRDDGSAAADGAYRLTLGVSDRAGNQTTRSWTIALDTTPAVVGATISPTVFSPNGDGAGDTVHDVWTSSERVAGTASVLHGTALVRRWSVPDSVGGTVTWNGLDAAGHRIGDGHYTIRLDVRDRAGNRTVVNRAVVLDRTAGFLRWSTTRFAPQDGDALAPTARVGFGLTRSATVSLAIVDAHGSVVRTIWSRRSFAAGTWGWTWNGRNADGAMVGQGRYVAVLTVTSSLGTSVLRRSVYAGAFILAPSATAIRAGQVLTVTIISVEPLKTRPTVTLTQSGLTDERKTATLLADGRYRVSFTIRPGGVGVATIAVKGTDSRGGTNRSTTTVTVQ
jgi:spore germination protein YaaH/flagellar hook assembly protein FlgD